VKFSKLDKSDASGLAASCSFFACWTQLLYCAADLFRRLLQLPGRGLWLINVGISSTPSGTGPAEADQSSTATRKISPLNATKLAQRRSMSRSRHQFRAAILVLCFRHSLRHIPSHSRSRLGSGLPCVLLLFRCNKPWRSLRDT
jgi:hypothetical protein